MSGGAGLIPVHDGESQMQRVARIWRGMALAALVPVQGFAEGIRQEAKLVLGYQQIAVIGTPEGDAHLVVDGAVLMEDGVIYLDEAVIVDGVPVMTGVAGAGGNACNAAPFVLALPESGAPELSGPVDSCARFTPRIVEGKLVFTSDPMPGAAGETWVWSRDGGFVPGPAIGFVPYAGWEALNALAGAHPADALAIAPVLEALQAGLGDQYPDFIERISDLGAGDLVAGGYLGRACLKFTCDADWAVLYLDAATEQVFAIWAMDGEEELRIWPGETTQWPAQAMAFLGQYLAD